jgi:plasmid maintenance system antidote protein VapI
MVNKKKATHPGDMLSSEVLSSMHHDTSTLAGSYQI